MAPGQAKQNNILNLWGNEKTMNLNSLILTNIQSSHYFKVNLYELKTYHEVIDEIYYKVGHLEPWEKGSRKTSGQTGMCGGVRGVGAGGIVSTAYCLLYKLFTLKLTRKQVNGLINHSDSPYIRALGFMYIRYTQPPADLWDWYEPYLDDEEEVDPKAGGGAMMNMGQLVKNFLTKLEWYSSLFPRIPVPIQKDIDRKLNEKKIFDASQNYEEGAEDNYEGSCSAYELSPEKPTKEDENNDGRDRYQDKDKSRDQHKRERSRDHHERDKSRDHHERDKSRDRHEGDRSRDRHERDSRDRCDKDRRRNDRYRRRSRERSRHGNSRNGDISEQIEKEKERQRRDRDKSDRHRRSRSRDRSSRKSHKKRRSRSRSRDKSSK